MIEGTVEYISRNYLPPINIRIRRGATYPIHVPLAISLDWFEDQMNVEFINVQHLQPLNKENLSL